jgi:hypothetical protein
LVTSILVILESMSVIFRLKRDTSKAENAEKAP